MSSAEILRQIVASGFVEGLRLPKFPDPQASAAAAYATRQYAPCGWLEAGLRTGGQAVLEALRTSDAKGLDPDDDEAG